MLSERQTSLDALTKEERGLSEDSRGHQARVAELSALKVRFEELARVYASDLERLEGLEEGGFLLQRFASMNCPLCGAVPEHQHHDHGMGGIEEQRRAVESEIGKIRSEARELAVALADADTEIVEVERRIVDVDGRLKQARFKREEAGKREVSARSIFLGAIARCEKLESDLESRRRSRTSKHRSLASRQRPYGRDNEPRESISIST